MDPRGAHGRGASAPPTAGAAALPQCTQRTSDASHSPAPMRRRHANSDNNGSSSRGDAEGRPTHVCVGVRVRMWGLRLLLGNNSTSHSGCKCIYHGRLWPTTDHNNAECTKTSRHALSGRIVRDTCVWCRRKLRAVWRLRSEGAVQSARVPVEHTSNRSSKTAHFTNY